MISPRTVAVIGALAVVVGAAQEEQEADQQHVAFFGQVRQTRLEVGNNTTVLEALSRIEPTDAADLRAVILVRRDPAPVVVEMDLRRMILTGNTTNNLVLRPGDLLWVPERGRQQQNPRNSTTTVNQQQQGGYQNNNQQAPQQGQNAGQDFDDDIPFAPLDSRLGG